MYDKHFQLSYMPFEGSPDRRFFYIGANQHKALDLLTTSLSKSGSICVLSAEAGCGKTTTVRMLIKSLPKRMRIIAIDDPRLDSQTLLSTILLSLSVAASSFESISELTLKLRKALESASDSGIITTVIIDEAQGLSDEVIEQIRLIYNIEGINGKMINFLLVGQDELLNIINKPMHKMFLSRVSTFASLQAMHRDEVNAYINFRIMQAGSHEPLFTDRAITLLHQKSKGLPRTINAIADQALMLAFRKNKVRVDSSILRKAASIALNERSNLKKVFDHIKDGILSFTIFEKAVVMAFAFTMAFVIFYVALFLTKEYVDSYLYDKSIATALNYDNEVKDAYKIYMDNVTAGISNEHKLVSKFNLDVRNSIFRGDAIDNLVKLYGFSRSDNLKSSCKDIESLNLKCITRHEKFHDLESLQKRSVISLFDDNLIPFYAVLMNVDEEYVHLLMQDRIYRVKRKYIEDHYNDEFTFIYNVMALDIINHYKKTNKLNLSVNALKFLQNKMVFFIKNYDDVNFAHDLSAIDTTLKKLFYYGPDIVENNVKSFKASLVSAIEKGDMQNLKIAFLLFLGDSALDEDLAIKLDFLDNKMNFVK